MTERFADSEIQEIHDLKENQNSEKSRSCWVNVWTSWAENKNLETNLLSYETQQLNENKQMASHDWISQVVDKKIAWFVGDTWHKYHSWYFKIVPNFALPTAS